MDTKTGLQDVQRNPLADKIIEEYDARLDEIHTILNSDPEGTSPRISFEVCAPTGWEDDEATGGYRTATDDESRRLDFSGYLENWKLQCGEALEMEIADSLDALAERLQGMATDLRVKASARE